MPTRLRREQRLLTGVATIAKSNYPWGPRGFRHRAGCCRGRGGLRRADGHTTVDHQTRRAMRRTLPALAGENAEPAGNQRGESRARRVRRRPTRKRSTRNRREARRVERQTGTVTANARRQPRPHSRGRETKRSWRGVGKSGRHGACGTRPTMMEEARHEDVSDVLENDRRLSRMLNDERGNVGDADDINSDPGPLIEVAAGRTGDGRRKWNGSWSRPWQQRRSSPARCIPTKAPGLPTAGQRR